MTLSRFQFPKIKYWHPILPRHGGLAIIPSWVPRAMQAGNSSSGFLDIGLKIIKSHKPWSHFGATDGHMAAIVQGWSRAGKQEIVSLGGTNRAEIPSQETMSNEKLDPERHKNNWWICLKHISIWFFLVYIYIHIYIHIYILSWFPK